MNLCIKDNLRSIWTGFNIPDINKLIEYHCLSECFWSEFLINQNFSISVTSNCSLSCGCDVAATQPVCGSNGADYFSPCHAGCTTRNETQVRTETHICLKVG